jgi:anaerobic magnesium-protoporphyrin IX monomethyl ester cyclase
MQGDYVDKALLLFPPGAQPSYRPLGAACLLGLYRTLERTGGLKMDFEVLDLNLECWNTLADSNPDSSQRLWRDFTSQGALFYDRELYLENIPLRSRAFAEMEEHLRTSIISGDPAVPPQCTPLLRSCAEKALGKSPRLLLLSCLYLQQLLPALVISLLMKQQKRDLTIIMGGAAISALEQEELLDAAWWIDALIPGEGEAAFEALLSGSPLESVPGLLSRRGINKPGRALEGKELPVPDFSFIPARQPGSAGLDGQVSFLPEEVIPLSFSRGCKWRSCRFCAHNNSFFEYRPKCAVMFVQELEELAARTGSRHFYFTDQYIDGYDLAIIAREIIRRGLKIHYHYMGRPTLRDYPGGTFELLSESGCRWISWGVESGSKRLLELTAKGTRPEDIAKVLHASSLAGINNLAMMIFGLPLSDEIALQETFDFIETISPSVAGITESSFVLYRNTPFGRTPRRFGLKPGEQELLFTVGEKKVHSMKTSFREIAADGTTRPPSGPEEISRWARRRDWIFPDPLYRSLPAEHYLLYAAHEYCCKNGEPDRPVPAGPVGPRAA